MANRRAGNTKRNSEAHVTGSPNPYAVQLLVEVARAFGASFVAQHPECRVQSNSIRVTMSPPGDPVALSSLAFPNPRTRPAVWSAQVHPPLERSYASALERMDHGLPVVG